MSDTFKYTRGCVQVSVDSAAASYTCAEVARLWDRLDAQRSTVRAMNRAVKQSLVPARSTKGLSMPEMYEVRETYKAHLWKSWWASLDTMFDVQGRTSEDHKRSNVHKAMLVDTFRSVGLAGKLDRGLDYWIDRGEFLAFVSWASGRTLEGTADEEYDGPDVTVMDPDDFVFDSESGRDFQGCAKVVRAFATPYEIACAGVYSNFEGLDAEAKAAKGNEGFREGRVELLEYWGDFTLEDGTVLEDWVLTVAGRSRLVRFEPNPFGMCPFVYAAGHQEPVSKRGISPLYVAIPLNQASETILNLQLDALRLIINKPYLAPRGSLSGKISVKEGSIIEYDPALMPQAPVPLDFKDAIVGWDFLKYFEQKIESATGVFKYMTGSTAPSGARTATEVSSVITGQNIRLSREVDLLNFRVKVPLIRKVASLLSRFGPDGREVKVCSANGDVAFVPVSEEVRSGSYEYVIGDSSSVAERRMRMKEAIEYLWQFSSHEGVGARIKWVEVMKWTLEQLGISDPSVFINEEEAL